MTVTDKPWNKPLSEEEENSPVFSTEYATVGLDVSQEKGSLAVIFSEDTLGRGDKDLGKDLVKSYLGAVMAKRLFPNYIVLLNSGVFLASQDAVTLDALKSLEQKGVSILVSEESADYYELRGSLRVGIFSSMEEIVVALHSVDRVISF